MTTLEAVCRESYERTRDFYRDIRERLGPEDFGYSILYGPPVERPPALFVGYQPGGAGDDGAIGAAAGNHETWPTRFAFVHESWTLARKVREIFPTTFLEQCAGLNLVFFRAPTIERYRALPLQVRRTIREHCEAELRRMISAMRPRLLVFIGLATLDALTQTVPALWSPQGRLLASEGRVEGISAIATLHLSGARIGTADRLAITEWLRNRSGCIS